MKKKLNVLWLMSDEHNWNCTGYNNNPNVKTPNLDLIAKKGVNFTNAFANNPICAPSRICYGTGQYAHTHGMFGNDNYECNESNIDYLPSLFRRYGYQTALFGKEHAVPKWVKESYEHVRFTDFCDAEVNDVRSNHYFKYLMDLGLEDYYEEGDRKPHQENFYDGGVPSYLPYKHTIERFTGNETLKFLEDRDESRPFFIHMSFQRPHDPVTPSLEFFNMYKPEDMVLPNSISDYYENHFEGKPSFMKEKFENNRLNAFKDKDKLKRWLASYYGLISAIDMEIGRVLEKLKETGELENTVIIYTADHGDFAGEHGLIHKNLGIYDSIQRIPFLISWPKGPENIKCDEIIESIDLYPTLCELCNIPLPENREGKSLIKVLNGEKNTDYAAFCETKNETSIRTKDYRLVYYAHQSTGELYDHRIDNEELNNLWENENYLKTRVDLTERLLSFTMKYLTKSDGYSTEILAEKNKYTPVKLLHKHGRYWSRLKHAYEEELVWPPEAND